MLPMLTRWQSAVWKRFWQTAPASCTTSEPAKMLGAMKTILCTGQGWTEATQLLRARGTRMQQTRSGDTPQDGTTSLLFPGKWACTGTSPHRGKKDKEQLDVPGLILLLGQWRSQIGRIGTPILPSLVHQQ